MEILDGKTLSDKIKDNLIDKLSFFASKPKLCVISVGNDEASKVYVNNKKKSCMYVGIDFENIEYDEHVTEEELINKIKVLNNDSSVNGIIVQLPLPEALNERNIINNIIWYKDVDALSDVSIGKMNNSDCLFVPCTAKGIIRILENYSILLEGKHVVVVGRSSLVGKPVLMECLKRNATCTICHTFTNDLKQFTKTADILIVATGNKYLIDKDFIKEDTVIIDVGINRENGILYGDVNPNVEEKCSALTPVPGGVGPMTVAMLLENTIISYKYMEELKNGK